MKVLNFGSLNIDYVYDVAHIVVEGETIPAVNRKIFCGGKGLNQSIALSKAGVPTYHAGRICNTDQFLVEMLQIAHVDISNVILDDSTPTGHAIKNARWNELHYRVWRCKPGNHKSTN